MNIGIDASRAARALRTGTENYSLYVIRALIDLGAHHTFTLYFNQPPEPGLFPARPNVRLRVIPFPRLWTQVRLAAEVRLRPPNVLFVPAHVLPLWPGRAVATVHDLGY
ncbi:MAG: glycosyltransferase family 1 protein, partial [Anaerolineae bacterium]